MRTWEYQVQKTIKELVLAEKQVTYDNIQDHLMSKHGMEVSIEFIKQSLEHECKKNMTPSEFNRLNQPINKPAR